MSSSIFKGVGSYKMDGFHLTINTDNSMETLTLEENQTLVHEYTHFLQSISTVYGWYRIVNLAIITQHLVYGIYQKDGGFVRRFPFFNPSGKDGELIESAMSLNTMLEGSNGEECNIKIINQSPGFYVVHDVKAECFSKHPDFDEEIMELPAGATLSKNIRVTYLFDPTGQRQENPNKIDVMLGAVCIYEFMAYAIEKHVSERDVILPQIPYFVVKDVAEFVLEMEVDDKIIACLCEFALQSRSPGETFYNLLIGLKKQKINYNVLTPDLMGKMFNACYVMETDDGPKSYSPIELLHKYADETLEEYKTLFSGLEDYKSITDLLSHINDAVNIYRKEDLFMISRILFQTPKEAISEITLIMKTVGIPPIFNNSGYIGHVISDHSYDRYYLFLPMLNEFVNFTSKGKFSCELYETCKKHSPEVINDNCNSNVYLKGKDDLLCGVGQIIKMWKLNDYTFMQ